MNRAPMLFFFLLWLLSSAVMGQETKVAIEHPNFKTNDGYDVTIVGCTNGGVLHLFSEVRVADAVPTCVDSSCKENSPDKLAFSPYVPSGHNLMVYCTTKATDEQSSRDWEFCKNNVSNPRPQSQAEIDKYKSEIAQCLKDRKEYRLRKDH